MAYYSNMAIFFWNAQLGLDMFAAYQRELLLLLISQVCGKAHAVYIFNASCFASYCRVLRFIDFELTLTPFTIRWVVFLVSSTKLMRFQPGYPSCRDALRQRQQHAEHPAACQRFRVGPPESSTALGCSVSMTSGP